MDRRRIEFWLILSPAVRPDVPDRRLPADTQVLDGDHPEEVIARTQSPCESPSAGL
jgi:hypothetical protein